MNGTVVAITPAYQAVCTLENQGPDRTTQPGVAGLGALLQACPRPNTLQQSRPLDRAAHLVASVQMLAQLRLETAAEGQNVRRVWVGSTGETDSFHCIAEEGVFVKAWRGKTAHHVWAADGGQHRSNPVRHLRPGGTPRVTGNLPKPWLWMSVMRCSACVMVRSLCSRASKPGRHG